MGDTSYSDLKSNLRYVGDNRGNAVSDIVVQRDQCTIQGYTERCEYFDYVVAPEGDVADPYVGHMQTADHLDKKFFVKAKLSTSGAESPNPSYLMSHVEGFGYEYAVLDLEQVRGALAGDPVEAVGDREDRRGQGPKRPASMSATRTLDLQRRAGEAADEEAKPVALRAMTWPRVAAAAAAAGAAGREELEEEEASDVFTLAGVTHCEL